MNADIVFRGIFLFVFLSAVVISGYYRKRARQSGEIIPRRAEGSTTLLLRMMMALIVAAGFFAYVFAPTWLAWSALELLMWLRVAAAVIALGTLPAMRWMFVSIGANISETILTKRSHQLVTYGPYRWIRHPLYAFALLLLFSLALLASNWFLLLFPCIGFVVFRFIVIPREEANLIKVFGEQYEEYRRHTGALIPRFRPRE